MNERPYALLAELSYRCPLHCPYCSNPTTSTGSSELTTAEWERVLKEAAGMGVLHVGFSGGEPLVRRDLEALIEAARKEKLYTNLITSGIGLDARRTAALKEAGLQSLQLSLQADQAGLADLIAGASAHQHKLSAARSVREMGIPLSMNIVVHRHNIHRLKAMIDLAADLEPVINFWGRGRKAREWQRRPSAARPM